MPALAKSLSRYDLGHLQIVAELWGLDLDAPDTSQGLKQLTAAMQQPGLLLEIIETLPPESQQALRRLAQNQGRLPWDAFERQYGPIRQMGPAKRDRELPHLAPVSTSEVLFYHGLLGRDFLNTPQGPQEFAYLPDELLEMLRHHLPARQPSSAAGIAPGRPARPEEHQTIIPAGDRILNDLTTLLAARRLGWAHPPQPLTVPQPFLEALLARLNVLKNGQPDPKQVKHLLETPRPLALTRLAQTWLGSDINDLCMTPQLLCEGTWQHNPLEVRGHLLSWLHSLPENTWWGIRAFIEDVHRKTPDFLRSGGEYEAWLIRRTDSEQYLKGFASWMEVEGALLRYLLTGPLHWLGLLDLAGPSNQEATAFRRSPLAADLLANRPAEKLPAGEPRIHLSSQGKIHLSPAADLALRYQIARFTEWETVTDEGYTYRITPASLQRAASQGLTSAHLLALLQKYRLPVPPALKTALARWEKQTRPAARLQTALLLRLASPQILAELQNSPAARFIQEQIGPTTVIIQPGARQQVLAALAERGWLTEDQSEGDE